MSKELVAVGQHITLVLYENGLLDVFSVTGVIGLRRDEAALLWPELKRFAETGKIEETPAMEE